MLRRVLIANRGEIARRIARTCERLGVDWVGVYSDADRAADHLRGAAATVAIGPGPATASYLRAEAMVAAALSTGCDAVHPGYGFLSENPTFARMVAEAGLIFVGPDADTIAAMGDKATAKRLMQAAGVPVVPGSVEAVEDPDILARLAKICGYPLILKPVAGGGGKGMQVVDRPDDLASAVQAAIRVGRAAFGDGRLLVERYIQRPRHVEVQVFGDRHGNVVHLFERECSLQRRHQKIVEEAPAPHLAPATRNALLEAAVQGARAIDYVGAGTFEFILGSDEAFHFLEVNTRLQVEHPVTEAITGLDLVEWQLRVAAGEALPLAQSAIQTNGHAIECRVYAEDPDRDFQPAPGRAIAVRWPDDLRVDAAFDTTGDVPPFYDPMVAKLVAHAPTRTEAIERLRRGIDRTRTLGLTTNLAFVTTLLSDPNVVAGRVDTGLVDRLAAALRVPDHEAAACACAAALVWRRATAQWAGSPWAGAVGPVDRTWLDQAAPLGRVGIVLEGTRREVRLISAAGDRLMAAVDEHVFDVTARPDGGSVWSGRCGVLPWAGLLDGAVAELVIAGRRLAPVIDQPADEDAKQRGAGHALAPMPGVVVALPLAVGERAEPGDTLAIVDAMKMENRVIAEFACIVEELRCRVGEMVAAGQELVRVVPAE
jgi:propionyl-CoA carboxylase alpha chain/3-methylcrotonyl-CoA carboxylase alpha subunit